MATQASEVPRATLYIALLFTLTTWFAILTPVRPPTPPPIPTSSPTITSDVEILHPDTRTCLRALRSNPEFLCLLITFAIYVASFNAFASLTQQFINPYGFSDVEAGIIGAVTVVAGLVTGALTAPIFDRTKAYKVPIALCVSAAFLSYLALIFVIRPYSTGVYIAILLLAGIIGSSGLILLPLALELASDVTFPVPPELTSSILWMGGQGLGGILIVIMDALRMTDLRYTHSLIFLAVIAALPLPFAYSLITSRKVEESRLLRNGDPSPFSPRDHFPS